MIQVWAAMVVRSKILGSDHFEAVEMIDTGSVVCLPVAPGLIRDDLIARREQLLVWFL